MNSINFRLLNASQLNAFVRTALSNFNLETMPPSVIKTLAERVVEVLALFGLGFERNPKDPYALEDEQKDALRDKYFNGLRHYVMSFLASPEADEQKAAEQILEVIYKHGRNAASMTDAKETTALTLMVAELERNLVPQLETIKAAQRVALLKAAQADYEATVTTRYANKAVEMPSTTKYRKELEDRFRKLLNALEADFEATNDAAVGTYIARIDELIAATMAAAKGSKTRRDNGDDDEPELPEPPTA